MTTFNILSLNVNGLNDPTKRMMFVHWLRGQAADVVCLQETHAPSHKVACSWFARSGFLVASSSKSSKSAGTAILIRKAHQLHQVWRDEEGRFVQVEIQVDEHRFRVAGLYAPNKNPARN